MIFCQSRNKKSQKSRTKCPLFRDGYVHWFDEKNVDFIDAYTAAWMLNHGLTDILTLDRKHFNRFEELNVINP